MQAGCTFADECGGGFPEAQPTSVEGSVVSRGRASCKMVAVGSWKCPCLSLPPSPSPSLSLSLSLCSKRLRLPVEVGGAVDEAEGPAWHEG